MSEHRILVPSAGGPGCVNLVRGLAMIPGVTTVGCDASPHFLFAAETEARYLVPRRDREDEYLEALLSIAAREGVDFIFPNNSLDGEILARRRSEVAVSMFLPSVGAFELGENKWASFDRFRLAGLPVPRTVLVSSKKDIEQGFESLGGEVVWVRGAGIPGKGIGVASLPARSVRQAEAWVDYWNGWGLMTLSEYLPGANLTWMAVFDHGKLVASQSRERDAYVIPHVSPSGITGAPAISHTVNRSDINEMGPRAVLAIDPAFHGPAFVDFKENQEGVACLTEINVGRFGTTHHFYSAAGANFPELVLRLAFGEGLPEWVRPFDVLPEGLYWVRTLDVGPVLVSREDIEALRIAGIIAGSGPRLPGMQGGR